MASINQEAGDDIEPELHPQSLQLNKISSVFVSVSPKVASLEGSSQPSRQSVEENNPRTASSVGWWRRRMMSARDPEMKDHASGFTGKKGLRKLRWVYHPKPRPDSDPEDNHGTSLNNDDTTTGKGKVVKKDGKYEYRNHLHQVVRKFNDVAVYLSSTNPIPRRLVVQSSQYVLKNHVGQGDWTRTKIQSNVPLVLRIAEWALAPLNNAGFWAKIYAGFRMLLVAVPMQAMLVVPGTTSREDDEILNSYTDYPGYYWDWPKDATNHLDMAPNADGNQLGVLDNRRRAQHPSKLVAKRGDKWIVDAHPEPGLQYVFISYVGAQFPEKGGKEKIQQMAQMITEMEGYDAYWMDEQVVEQNADPGTEYDVYTMCDTVRGAKRVVVILPDNSLESREIWGRRMWTLPQGLLAPGESLRFCYPDPLGQLQVYDMHKVEVASTVWAEPGGRDEHEGISPTRILAEHFSGLATLSRLELLPAAIAALGGEDRNEFTGSDHAYAVMGLLHYRIKRSDGDTLFQNLARISLSNESDQLVERMLSLLPQLQPAQAPDGRALTVPRPIFNALSERDQFETLIHHVTPLCDVVGVAAEDETVIIDNCRTIHIRWKGFPQAVVQRHYGFKKRLVAFVVAAGLYWLDFGLGLILYYLPYWGQLITEELAYTFVCGCLLLGFLLSAFSPLSVHRLFDGTVLKSSSNLVGFEGVMPIAELETIILGNCAGRLRYAPSATPLSRGHRHPRERRGTEPAWVGGGPGGGGPADLPAGHHLFTLVDMGELSVSVFSAERPPTVALLCGREGGMLRAVLCSWRFQNDCLYKETVVRMPSRVYEAATANSWLKLCLKTQDQARRSELARGGKK